VLELVSRRRRVILVRLGRAGELGMLALDKGSIDRGHVRRWVLVGDLLAKANTAIMAGSEGIIIGALVISLIHSLADNI